MPATETQPEPVAVKAAPAKSQDTDEGVLEIEIVGDESLPHPEVETKATTIEAQDTDENILEIDSVDDESPPQQEVVDAQEEGMIVHEEAEDEA